MNLPLHPRAGASAPRTPITLALLAVLCLPTSPALRGQNTLQAPWNDGELVAYRLQTGFALESDGQVLVRELPRESLELHPNSLVTPAGEAWIAGELSPSSAEADSSPAELFVQRLRGNALEQHSVPNSPAAGSKTQPVLLAEDRLDGMAWLEGNSVKANEVWFSSWRDGRFEDPQQVAARGPGSQTALAGATLPDGSLLLVWARYDGEDDEIVWSRRIQEAWTTPRPLSGNNSTPDIAPAVAATPAGAQIFWNRFEGGRYELAKTLLGLEGNRLEQGPIETFSDAYFPSVVRTSQGAYVLAKGTDSWKALRLGDEDIEGIASASRSEGQGFPYLVTDRGQVEFVWMDSPSDERERAAARFERRSEQRQR